MLLMLAACGDEDATDDARAQGAQLGSAVGSRAGDDPAATTSSTTPRTTAPPTTAPPESQPEVPASPTPVDLPIDSVTAPATAAPGFDACNNTTYYDATNLVDGVVDTAWRMDGDGTGQSLTLYFAGPQHVTEVGLIPGYAKVDPCDGVDRFFQNRRVTSVTWIFDDGSSVTQPLAESAALQTFAVDTTTTSIVLRIDAVTASPERDFTALSEIAVRGT